jgi:hypothetical protein
VFTTPALVVAAVLVSQLPAPLAPEQDRKDEPQQQRSAPGRSQTDQTVNVQKGTRVSLTSCMGTATVKTWDRDAVHVQGDHFSRTKVNVELRDQVLLISATSGRGRDTDDPVVDYVLTVPAWINMNIDGDECNMDITGITGNVVAHTTDGEIILHNLGGSVDARSVDGKIIVDGGRGKIQVNTVDDDIEISKASGEITAESIDGDVKLTDMQATSLDVSSVDGDITFSGTLQPSGHFQFTTHDGDVVLFLPDSTSATFGIRTFQGELHSSLSLKAAGQVSRGRRTTYTLGGGSAQIEIETFEGDVYLRKPGEVIKKD